MYVYMYLFIEVVTLIYKKNLLLFIFICNKQYYKFNIYQQ